MTTTKKTGHLNEATGLNDTHKMDSSKFTGYLPMLAFYGLLLAQVIWGAA